MDDLNKVRVKTYVDAKHNMVLVETVSAVKAKEREVLNLENDLKFKKAELAGLKQALKEKE